MLGEMFENRVRRYLGAGAPLLVVVTHEEDRAIAAIRSIATEGAVECWRSTTGLERHPNLCEPEKALDHAITVSEAGIFVFLDLHRYLDEPRVVRAVRDFVEIAPNQGKAIIIVMPSIRVPVELEQVAAVVELPLPTEAELTVLCEELARRHGRPATVANAYGRAAAGLTYQAARLAFRMALGAIGDTDGLAVILGEKRRVLRRSAALQPEDTRTGMEEVGGLSVLKAWLKDRVAAFQPGACEFGLPQPRGMLVCGVQGCGKSLIAKATAVQFGLPLVRLDFGSIYGQQFPEDAIRNAFRVLEAAAPVVLWVDEVDKALAPQGAGLGRVFGEFLIWLQEKRQAVFVAATANEVEHLPPELARRGRFDEVFFVDLPGQQEREQILGIHLRRRGRVPGDFDLEQVAKATDQYSGAELEQVVVGALFRAYSANREVIDEDLRLVARETVPLATMYEERVQALRTWAQTRARRASADRRTLELFEE